MLSELKRIRLRFTGLILIGFLLAPLAGLTSALLFGLITPADLQSRRTIGILAGFVALVACWVVINFSSYFNPLDEGAEHRRRTGHLPEAQQRRLASFSRDYWGTFLLYALATPPLLFITINKPIAGSLEHFLQLLVLQLSVVALVGLPTYQLALDQIGKLAGHLSLENIQVSLKSKLMLMGGFVPLLSYSVLMNYSWQQTGNLTPGHMAIWLTLVVTTGLITLFSVRSLAQALEPMQDMLMRGGASLHAELARLQPKSTDEIGFMTQSLGKLFYRLGEQEAQLRAVMETAAEGIVVISDKGLVKTVNPAAEKLFGYAAAEIRQHPVKRLMPDLPGYYEKLQSGWSEIEAEGYHRNGALMQLSVRITAMQSNRQQQYICMVADITCHKTTENLLRDSQNRYRDLVETAHDLVWTVNARGHLTYLNRACENIYGYPPESMLQHSIDEFRSPDHPPVDKEAIESLIKGMNHIDFETVHLDSEGKPHFLSFSARSHRDSDGNVVQISGTARDITEQKAFQHQLSYHAEHDALTGLFNRNYFQQELERTVARIRRSGSACALFYIDLDQFKYINDTRGHATGDRLLVDVGTLLSTHVRDGDLLARFGGDEFTLLLYNISECDVLRAADNFRMLCNDYKFAEDDKFFNIPCSIGIAMIDANVNTADEILSHADLACNMAKQQGRNRVHLYNPADLDKAGMAADMGWAAQVRKMLEQDRFQLVYQPIVEIGSGVTTDYEVLVRMVCDDGQIILPGGFMPAAERFGLIHSVDRWIVRHSIGQLSKLHKSGQQASFSINLSGKAFEDAGLLPMIQELLTSTGLDPTWITFEITETAAIANLTAAEKFIVALKDIGCQFALDDFGSGFSSFTYLKHLPVDKLKIDGAFVKGMAHSSVDQAMVESMNQIAHALGKQTIAECVENAETLQILEQIGVDRAQGNYVGRPRETPLRITRHTQPAELAAQPH